LPRARACRERLKGVAIARCGRRMDKWMGHYCRHDCYLRYIYLQGQEVYVHWHQLCHGLDFVAWGSSWGGDVCALSGAWTRDWPSVRSPPLPSQFPLLTLESDSDISPPFPPISSIRIRWLSRHDDNNKMRRQNSESVRDASRYHDSQVVFSCGGRRGEDGDGCGGGGELSRRGEQAGRF
jgi:hypothetical protein